MLVSRCRSELLAKVHQATRQMQEELLNPPKRRARPVADTGQPVRDGNVELITMMLEALEKEHEFL